MRARAPPFQHFLRGGYKRGLHAFHGAGGRGEATAGEPVLASPLWGMLYADDARAVSQSPERLRKTMGVIVVVCAAFDLNVSEAKTDTMCSCTKGMPESTASFSGPGAQPDE